MTTIHQAAKATTVALGAVIVVAHAPCASGDTFIEDFENGSNVGQWTWGTGSEFVESTGGNPGAYLREDFLDTFAPQPRTTRGVASVFTGDYRARNVTEIGIDLILHSVDTTAEGRPLSILLVSENGTPGDFNDDWAAFFIGTENVPLAGEGWKEYSFTIPSQSPTTPAGWGFLQFGPDSPANPAWEDIITNVDQLSFFYGDPTMFFIFQGWDLGMDNPRITTDTGGATITGVEAAFGTLTDGGVQELGDSDDTYVVGRSQFGFTATEPNIFDIVVDAQTTTPAPSTIDLTIEGHLNTPGGVATARLMNWATSAFQQVGQYATSTVDTVESFNGIDAANFVRSKNGGIRLSIRQSVIATFSASGFESFTDQALMIVN